MEFPSPVTLTSGDAITVAVKVTTVKAVSRVYIKALLQCTGLKNGRFVLFYTFLFSISLTAYFQFSKNIEWYRIELYMRLTV